MWRNHDDVVNIVVDVGVTFVDAVRITVVIVVNYVFGVVYLLLMLLLLLLMFFQNCCWNYY